MKEGQIEREIPIQEVDAGTLSVISRAEIDVQVSTAHRYPRSVSKFVEEATGLVSLTEQIAEECIYALPRDGKTIEGPSARFAEIIASCWGNSRAGARVVDESGDFITAQGVFHDLQRNVAITYEVKRRIVNKKGERFGTDMIAVTGNAASSIALRNAILKGVPKAFWSSVYDAARKTIMGDFQTLTARRTAALTHFQKFGVTPAQIFEKLGVKGEEDISLDHIVILRGMMTAIKEDDLSVEQMFPKPGVEMPKAKEAKKEEPKKESPKPDNAADAAPPPPPSSAPKADVAPQAPASAPAAEAKKPEQQKPAEAKAEDKPLSDGQKKILRAKLKNAKMGQEVLEKKFGQMDNMRFSQFNELQEFITGAPGQ